MIAANTNWVIALDNVSHLSPAFSDALCRLSTGGGLATRALYTDEDEFIFEAQRPVILNGIEEIATRGDLLDRAMILYLPAIPGEERRPESELLDDFESARPRILGALLDTLVVGLRNLPNTRLPRLPRMADFALWVTSTEPALAWAPGTFMTAYDEGRESANDLVLESSPVAHALIEFVEAKGTQELTATALLKELTARVEEGISRQKTWPSNGKALSGVLRRLAANLRSAGLQVEFLPRRGRARLIRLERVGGEPSSASPPSPVDSSPPLPSGSRCGPGDAGDGRDADAPSGSDDPGDRIRQMFG